MITYVAAVETEEAEEAQQTVNSNSVLSYLLKPPSFLMQVFKDNKKA